MVAALTVRRGGRYRPPRSAAPTRYASLGRTGARTTLALVVALLALALVAAGAGRGPARPGSTDERQLNDLLFQDEVVESVRHGGDYYQAVADARGSSGSPLRPSAPIRLPTLAIVEAALPRPVMRALLYLLAAGTLLAWWARLRGVVARGWSRALAVALLGAGELAFLRPELVLLHEIWAALLVSLSLAVWRPGRWVESAAVASCAALIRETGVLYAIVMLGGALIEGRRREALGWAGALGVFALALLLHAHAILGVSSGAAGVGWLNLMQPGSLIGLVTMAAALPALPLALCAVLVVLALVGWIGWRDPLAARVAALLALSAAAIALSSGADAIAPELFIVPPLLLGLAFTPDSLRELWRAARGRRVTVRVAQ